MSLIFMEGFDWYLPNSVASSKWTTNGGNVSPTAARNGAQGWLFPSPNGSNFLVRNIGSNNGNTMVFGYAMRNVAPGFSGWIGPAFYDGTSVQVDVRLTADGRLFITRNGTVLATSTLVINDPTVWNFFEFKAKIDPTVGTAEVRVNGVVFCSFSGNTSATGTSFANVFQLHQLNLQNGNQYYDDFYLLDSSGALDNDYLGDCAVQQTYAIADGGTNNWARAWASWAASTVTQLGTQILDSNGNVQEATAVTSDAKTGTVAPTWATTGGTTTTDNHVTWTVRGSGLNPGAANWMAVSELYADNDSSYVVDSTPGDIDLYQFGTISSPGGNPHGVQITAIADKDDAGTRSIRLLAKSGVTTVDNGADLPLTQNSYQAFQAIFETDPNTSAQWTAAGINAARFGEKEVA